MTAVAFSQRGAGLSKASEECTVDEGFEGPDQEE
jgi:hypothetical protein